MARIDLTGQRFGKLTVIQETPEQYISPAGVKGRRWDCVCDCGTHLTVLQNALTSAKNGTKSCGCFRREKGMPDLTGRRFGRITVIGPAPLSRTLANGVVTGWRCHCDCGKDVVIPTKNLTTGKGKKSCGCMVAERSRERVNDAVGHVDGTALSLIKPGLPANKGNKSGKRGVNWSERDQRWIAKIYLRGKSIYLGRFTQLEDAIKARQAAEDELFRPILEANGWEEKK